MGKGKKKDRSETKKAESASIGAEEIMGQYLLAFGAGAGTMRVRRVAVTALRERYLPCIQAALDESPELWDTQGSQVLYFVGVIGQLAALRTLESGQHAIDGDVAMAAAEKVERESRDVMLRGCPWCPW
jgi:hypothetical protein